MRYFFFLFASSWLPLSAANAQVGVRAGGELTFPTTAADKQYDYTTLQRKLGYQVSAFYQFSLSRRIALVPEIGFSRTRFAVDKSYWFGDGYLAGQYEQSLSHLLLPVLVRASFGALYVEAGPQANWLVGGRAIGTQTVGGGFTGRPYTYELNQPATRYYRRLEVGPSVGVGVKLPAGVRLGVRAYWSVNKPLMDDNSSLLGPTYPAFTHRQTWQAFLTYQFASR